MSALDHLLSVAAEYARADGAGVKAVSWRVFGDSKKLEAIRDDGADIQVRRLEKAMGWFSANWPSDAVWPAGVTRPDIPANDPLPHSEAA